MTNLIRLTEITKSGDGTKRKPMLLNPDFIATVTTGELKKDGPYIIGSKPEGEVTFIHYKNGQGTFVDETLDEIDNAITFGQPAPEQPSPLAK